MGRHFASVCVCVGGGGGVNLQNRVHTIESIIKPRIPDKKMKRNDFYQKLRSHSKGRLVAKEYYVLYCPG